jgi:hypothetical protein
MLCGAKVCLVVLRPGVSRKHQPRSQPCLAQQRRNASSLLCLLKHSEQSVWYAGNTTLPQAGFMLHLGIIPIPKRDADELPVGPTNHQSCSQQLP